METRTQSKTPPPKIVYSAVSSATSVRSKSPQPYTNVAEIRRAAAEQLRFKTQLREQGATGVNLQSPKPPQAATAAVNPDQPNAPSPFSDKVREDDEFSPKPPQVGNALIPAAPAPVASPAPAVPALSKDQEELQRILYCKKNMLPQIPQQETERLQLISMQVKQMLLNESPKYKFKSLFHLRAHNEFKPYGFTDQDVFSIARWFHVMKLPHEKYAATVDQIHTLILNCIATFKRLPLVELEDKVLNFY
jgi:hypothetical protein